MYKKIWWSKRSTLANGESSIGLANPQVLLRSSMSPVELVSHILHAEKRCIKNDEIVDGLPIRNILPMKFNSEVIIVYFFSFSNLFKYSFRICTA